MLKSWVKYYEDIEWGLITCVGIVRDGFRRDLWVESLRVNRYFPGENIPKRDKTIREYYWNHNSNTKNKHSDVFQER